MSATADPGSFRDPMSRVFVSDDAVLRALDGEALADYEALESSAFFREAVDAGRIVGTERGEAPAELTGQGWAAVLRHERIPFVSYPYEWPFEMLRDAAVLQLDLVAAALEDDLTTKDASSYNVQFVGSRPTFIDVGSFERLRADEPWYGYRQFCQLFLFPLMLQAYRGLAFQPWLRARVGGISPIEARRAMSRRDLLRKGVLLHVALHARAEQRLAGTERDVKAELKKSGYRKEIHIAQNRGLRKVVDKLRWKESESAWSGYSERRHYTDDDLATKERFVEAAASRSHRSLVWDLGANDGRFSRLVAPHADYVVAVDQDPLVVDALYRSLRDEGDERILPLVMDLSDPSPGLGWRSRERRAFVDRGQPDLVLALAVVHHMAITANVPIGQFVDFLAELGAETVVEFPRPDDPMVERLLRNKRAGVHDDYAEATFEKAVGDAGFRVEAREELPSGTRVLYLLVPRFA